MNITRKRQKTETLKIKPCPFCGGDVVVSDCGYSSFNPGKAQCQKCPRKWRLGYVEDDWEAGIKWNELQPKAKEIEKLEQRLAQLRGKRRKDGSTDGQRDVN